MTKLKVFTSPSCAPCVHLKEVLKDFDNVEYINVPDNMDIVEENNVRMTPTTIIYKDDKEVKRLIGMQPKSVFEQFM